jgi:hypothetical protein
MSPFQPTDSSAIHAGRQNYTPAIKSRYKIHIFFGHFISYDEYTESDIQNFNEKI